MHLPISVLVRTYRTSFEVNETRVVKVEKNLKGNYSYSNQVQILELSSDEGGGRVKFFHSDTQNFFKEIFKYFIFRCNMRSCRCKDFGFLENPWIQHST